MLSSISITSDGSSSVGQTQIFTTTDRADPWTVTPLV